MDDELSQQLQDCIALGVARTPHQNLLFIVDQLVESAARALSPGVNDPYTAIICMRWLGSGLIVMTHRQDPEPYRYDSDENLRVVAKSVTFRDVCSAIIDQLRPYYATDRNAAIQMMQTIATVRSCTRNEDRRALLNEHADKLLTSAQMIPLSEYDITHLRDADQRVSSDGSGDDQGQREPEWTNG